MFPTNLNRSTQGLIALSALCIALVCVRVTMKEETRFSFLIWNLFLAWIPFFITSLAAGLQAGKRNRWAIFLVFPAWLLFFPNAPYIITDLLHLKGYSQNILWFDCLLIFLFAFTGLIVGLHSLQKAYGLFRHYFNAPAAWLLILSCSVLSGFGVYLGRYCRLNSWDLFHKPFWSAGRIIHQFDNPLSVQVTLVFGFILFGLYSIYHHFYAPVGLNQDWKD